MLTMDHRDRDVHVAGIPPLPIVKRHCRILCADVVQCTWVSMRGERGVDDHVAKDRHSVGAVASDGKAMCLDNGGLVPADYHNAERRQTNHRNIRILSP